MAKLTAIAPGMNSFQWDLRYPDATEVTGFRPPDAEGGMSDDVDGPTVNPGLYTVELDYDGHATRQNFEIALDPRLHPAKDALQRRLALQLRIHAELELLDTTINEAIAMRDRLTAAIADRTLGADKARAVAAALNNAIDSVVQLNIRSSEGDVMNETKLRSYLAYLASDVGLAYERPTEAQYAVFESLDREARASEQKLQIAAAAAKRLL